MAATALERSRFIESNLGLVYACANRFRGRGIEFEDLVSAGNLGLVKAVDGFDESRGVCFSTYAVPVILGEIKKQFRDGGTIKVSRSLKEIGLKAMAVREKALKASGCEPTISQIAQSLGLPPEQVALAVRATQPALSLTPAGEEDDRSVLDIPMDSYEETLGDHLSLAAELAQLPQADRQLLTLRFYKGLTQTQTAQQLGTTQVQISRRERRLLAQLRQRLI